MTEILKPLLRGTTMTASLVVLLVSGAEAADPPASAPCLLAHDESLGGEPVVPFRVDPGGRLTERPVFDSVGPFGQTEAPGRPGAAVPIAAWSEPGGRYAIAPVSGLSSLRVYEVLPSCSLRALRTYELDRCPDGTLRRIDNLLADTTGVSTRIVATSGTCSEIEVFLSRNGRLRREPGLRVPTASQSPVTGALLSPATDESTAGTVLVTSSARTSTVETYRLASDGRLARLSIQVVDGPGPPAGLDVAPTQLTDGLTLALGFTGLSVDASVMLFELDPGSGSLKLLDRVAVGDGRTRVGAEIPILPLTASGQGPHVSIWATQPAGNLLSCIVIEQLDIDPEFIDLLGLPCPTAMAVTEIDGTTYLSVQIFDGISASLEIYEVLPGGDLLFVSSTPVRNTKSQGVVFVGG